MSKRAHIVLDEKEKEVYRRAAECEGLSLSAWIREAAREKLASSVRGRQVKTVEDLERFWAACRRSEKGVEPDWEQQKVRIGRSARTG